MIGALILDFDGVVVDTERPEFRAWREIYRRHGCRLEVSDWAQGIGSRGRFDPYATLLSRAARPVAEEAEVRRAKRLLARPLLDDAKPLPGVMNWVTECRLAGVPVGIASSSTPDAISRHLDRLGLNAQFKCIACYDGTLRAKPEPDTYLAACERLGVSPSRALAVEDAPHGVAAAVAAGLRCVAVPHDLTRDLDFTAAEMVLDSLSHKTFREVVEMLFRS